MDARANIVVHDSLLNAEADCQMRGLVAHRIGLRRVSRSTAYRRGTIGHAFVEHVLKGLLCREDLDVLSPDWPPPPVRMIVDKLQEREKWTAGGETYEEAYQRLLAETAEDAYHAAAGAFAVLAHDNLRDVVSDYKGPCVERKGIVPIDMVIEGLSLSGVHADTIRSSCSGASYKYDALIHGPAERLEMVDWKFKGSAPDDYASGQAPSLPDPQASLYAVLLGLVGVDIAYAGQVHVHAEGPPRPLLASEIRRNKDGLPSLSHKYTTAAIFMEALGRPVDTLPIKGKIREKYAEHIAALEAADLAEKTGPTIIVRSSYIFKGKAIALSRERFEMFADHLRFRLARRNLRVYPRSACVGGGRFNCEAMDACHMVSDGLSLDQAIATLVADGSHRLVYEEKEEKCT